MKDENGVAIVLAICVTALLLCLGITYVTTSIIEKKAAANYQNMVAARAAAQTAFNRAIALMKDASIDPEENFNAIVSHRGGMTSWTNADTETLAAKLTTVINGINYYSLPGNYPSGYTATDSSAVTWIYFRLNQTDTGKIIGRIAYVVIPDKGKINPWSVVDSGVNAAIWNRTPPSELSYGGVNAYTSLDPVGNYIIGRPGRDLTELCLASLEADTATFMSAYTQQMSVKTCSPTGLIDTGSAGEWKDYEQIFSTLGLAADDDTTRNYFKKVFYVNAPKDPEAFWIDISNDSIRDPSELYHRFNLTRNDWSNVTVGSILNSNGTKFKSSVWGGESNYLPWLKNWNDAGGFQDVNNAKHQIIANLIDYCDSDTNATTDYSVNNPPTYVGLERCPYINEVKIQINAKIQRYDGDGSNNRDFDFTTSEPTVFVELVNMYGITNNTTVAPYTTTKAYVDSIRIDYQWGKVSNLNNYTPSISNLPLVITPIATPQNYSSNSASMSGGSLSQLSQRITGVNNISSFAIKIKITGLRIRLVSSDAGEAFYDYVCLPDTDFISIISSVSSTTSVTRYLTIDWEASDPRQNLNTWDWGLPASLVGITLANSENTTIQSLGTTNNRYITARSSFSGTDTDKESANNPWEISTAYIRNAPMKSPWELGFIHRAKAFQTLNLKKYNDNTTNGYGFRWDSGGGAYSDGDVNILDQVKMSSNIETLGKINVNSDNLSVLRILFDHIAVGSIPDDPGASTATVLSIDNANAIAHDVKSANGSSQGTGTPFLTRAQIVNRVSSLSDGSVVTQSTDRKQEETIGKFINLTKADPPDQYTIIAIGEAIRDVGGTRFDKYGNAIVTPTDIGNYEQNSDEILASQKILAIIKRDFINNRLYIQRMIYLSN